MRKPISVTMLIVLLALGASSFSLGACSTTEGFGQDVQDTGKYIEDKAEDASD